jgi:metabolite-proton symporter
MSDARTTSANDIRRVVLASFIGTTIEWYDFFIYGLAAATVFDKLYFPSEDPFVSRMASFGAFAIGFFARPLGGVIFGHYGDRLGRKTMLVTTLMLMGLATFAIGLLPTYETIGIAAPVLLVMLRVIQGIGVGGEWGGAVLMAVEHGHAGRRGFYGGFVQMGVPAGLLLAAGVFAAVSWMPDEDFLGWAWRIPFLLGIVLLGIGMFIRVKLMESPLFAKVQEKETLTKIPILQILARYKKNVLLTMGARFAENACFYIFSVWIVLYATEQLHYEKQRVMIGIWLAAVVQLLAIPGFATLSDRVGRRPVYLCGALFLAVFAFPFFGMVESGREELLWLAIVLALVGHAAMFAPQAAFFSELFGTNVRYSGVSIGYQLASPFAGGLAPLIATALLEWSNNASWPVAVYLIATAAITLISIVLAEETFNHDISG